MQAGLLRDFIEVQRPEVSRDEYGAQKVSLVPFWKGRAQVSFSKGGVSVVNNETFHTMTKKIKVRYPVDFSADMQILHDGLRYRILSLDRNVKDMSTTFTCELINE